MKSFRTAFGVLLFSAIGVISLAWVPVAFERAEYLTVVVVVNIAVACIAFVFPAIKILLGEINPRVRCDGLATKVLPDALMELAWHSFLIGAAIGMGLLSVLYPLGNLDIPVPHSMRYSVPFMSGAVAVMAASILWRNFKRGGSKFLRLTSDGFEISEGSTCPRGAWEDVQDIADRVPGESPPKDYHAIVMVMSDGQAPVLSADAFTPGGRALREWVRFYWQHAECRDELTDGRAVERLRSEEFSSE